jgi:phosphohistidine phosphatase
MKKLFLVRHAKSSWKDPDLPDRERPLNNRGKRDAPFMGKVLRERGVELDSLISSPAKRAMATARFIAHGLKYPKSEIVANELLYNCTMNDLLTVIRGIKNTLSAAMIICHDSSIAACTNFITDASMAKFPTCGVLCVEFSIDQWTEVGKEKGAICYFEYPKQYFK